MIEQYKKMWVEYSFRIFIFGILSIIMAEDFVREYMSMNLLVVFLKIDIWQMLIRNYICKKQNFD